MTRVPCNRKLKTFHSVPLRFIYRKFVSHTYRDVHGSLKSLQCKRTDSLVRDFIRKTCRYIDVRTHELCEYNIGIHTHDLCVC